MNLSCPVCGTVVDPSKPCAVDGFLLSASEPDRVLHVEAPPPSPAPAMATEWSDLPPPREESVVEAIDALPSEPAAPSGWPMTSEDPTQPMAEPFPAPMPEPAAEPDPEPTLAEELSKPDFPPTGWRKKKHR